MPLLDQAASPSTIVAAINRLNEKVFGPEPPDPKLLTTEASAVLRDAATRAPEDYSDEDLAKLEGAVDFIRDAKRERQPEQQQAQAKPPAAAPKPSPPPPPPPTPAPPPPTAGSPAKPLPVKPEADR
jgi:hypothetical protein